MPERATLTAAQLFDAKRATFERLQACINSLPRVQQTALHLKFVAMSVHAEYPQYAGYWDDWKLAVITSRQKTKAGVAFEKNDLVIVSEIGGIGTAKAYSIRTGLNTVIPTHRYELID